MLKTNFLIVLLLGVLKLCIAQKYAEFSPDGTMILTADFDSLHCRVFDAQTKKFIKEINFKGYQKEKEDMGGGRIPLSFLDPPMAHFSFDGKSVFTNNDFTLTRWDLDQSKGIIIKGTNGGMTQDRKKLVVHQSKAIQIYDTQTKKVQMTFKGKGAALISPDGKKLANLLNDYSSEKSELQLIDAAGGIQVLKSTKGGTYNYFRGFSPDGKIFASGLRSLNDDEKANLLLWEVASGKFIDSLAGNLHVEFNPNGKQLLTLALGKLETEKFSDNFVTVWDADSRMKKFKLEGHEQNLTGALFSPDGKKIVTTSLDGVAIVWDASTGMQLFKLDQTGEIVVTGFDSNGSSALITSTSEVSLWDINSGTLLYSFVGKNATR